MLKNKSFALSKETKILITANNKLIADEKRLLIPFINGGKIGFINKDMIVVIPAEYSMYYGECYDANDFIIVCKPSTKTSNKNVYGLINAEGEFVLSPEYYELLPSIDNNKIYTVRNDKNEYGIINIKGEIIVPFGKYDIIDGFTNGVARVKIGKDSSNFINNGNRWGIINSNGNEVLPVEYDAIWKFYGKNQYNSIIVEKNGIRKYIKFSDLMQNEVDEEYDSSCYDDYDYGSHYGEYAGTYAQDVAGYSDDIINDVFEGDPDAYWNID